MLLSLDWLGSKQLRVDFFCISEDENDVFNRFGLLRGLSFLQWCLDSESHFLITNAILLLWGRLSFLDWLLLGLLRLAVLDSIYGVKDGIHGLLKFFVGFLNKWLQIAPVILLLIFSLLNVRLLAGRLSWPEWFLDHLLLPCGILGLLLFAQLIIMQNLSLQHFFIRARAGLQFGLLFF